MDELFEKEDGELSESDGGFSDNEEPYNPLSRPTSDIARPRNVPSSVISSEEEISASEDDSDSEFGFQPKRRKTNTLPVRRNNNSHIIPNGDAKKRNNIWSNVLQEEELTKDICGVGLKKIVSDRSVESYDYSLALKERMQEDGEEGEEKDDDGELENEEPVDEMEDSFQENLESAMKRANRKRRFCDISADEPRMPKKINNRPRYLSDIDLTLDQTDEELGHAIASALYEHKPELIVRVVQVLGREKALQLYSETQDVEKKGGLLILNGARRRTSGGVFLFLLRTNDGVERSKLAEIFCEDREVSQQIRRKKRVRRRQRDLDKETKQPSEHDALHLRGLFTAEDGVDREGTKCPGSTPVSTPNQSDDDLQPTPRLRTGSMALPMKEVCEKAASEIVVRDEAEKKEAQIHMSCEGETMDTC